MLMYALLIPAANAAFMATGKITKFHVGVDPQTNKENFAVYLQSTKGCATGWYYSYNTYNSKMGWKMLFDLSIVAYKNGKTISIFNRSMNAANCNSKRFEAIDTVN